MTAAAALYKDLYGNKENADISIPATFQLLFFIGWKPHPSQVLCVNYWRSERSERRHIQVMTIEICDIYYYI